MLLRAGADVNYPKSYPPILEAVRRGHGTYIETVIESGADVDLLCVNLKSLFCRTEIGQKQCAVILSHTGADVNVALSVAEAALISCRGQL